MPSITGKRRMDSRMSTLRGVSRTHSASSIKFIIAGKKTSLERLRTFYARFGIGPKPKARRRFPRIHKALASVNLHKEPLAASFGLEMPRHRMRHGVSNEA
jgi:hypothetical protein